MKHINVIVLCLFFFQNACKDAQSVSVPPTPVTPTDSNPLDTTLTIDFITGHFTPDNHKAFVAIPEKYADRSGMYLQKEAFGAFVKMYEAALKDGIYLIIRSASRNHDYQKGIWERKWSGQTTLSDGTKASNIKDAARRAVKILEYSSMPGTSRHHWGTDIDLNSFDNLWFEVGEGLDVFTWLNNNAEKFGFCRPYTMKSEERPFGYNEEKWHWSYFPLASKYLNYAEKHLDVADITGFSGAEAANTIDVINKYILGVSPDCK